jgi:DNA/RNA endonuclease YhcR with UshA esterase domain
MNLQKTTFILSLTGILLLILLAQTTPQTQTGKIKSIRSSNNKITIQLENNSAELILFDTSYINLSKGNTISFQGRRDTYKNKEQIIINKLHLIKP